MLEFPQTRGFVVDNVDVGKRDLVILCDISDCVDGFLADGWVPSKSGVGIAGVIEAGCMGEDRSASLHFHTVGLKDGHEGRRRADARIMLFLDAAALLDSDRVMDSGRP